MTFVPFGELRPDLEALNNPGALKALNVVPDASSYRPLRRPVALGSPLSEKPLTAMSFYDTPTGGNFTLAGTASTLERYVAGAWSVLASGFTANRRTGWAFQPFGRYLLAGPGNAELRRINLDTNAVTTIAGSPHLTCMAVVRDFVVGGAGQTLHNSDIDDATNWSTGLSNSKLLPTGGVITGITGGEIGYVFQESSIRRLTLQGDLFQIDEIETDHGCTVPGSLIKYRSNAFYLARNGFHAFDGGTSIPIGEDRIDKTFWRQVDEANIEAMRATIDPINKLVAWCYPSRNSPVAGLCDRMLFFHYGKGRWSEGEINADLVMNYVTEGIHVDTPGLYPDIDASDVLVDSRIFLGGEPILSIIDENHRFSTLTGDTLPASLQTKEVELGKANAVHLKDVRSVVDGARGSLSAQVRRYLSDAPQNVTATYYEDRPVANFDREECRFARFQLDMPAGETWQHAMGIEIDEVVQGGGA